MFLPAKDIAQFVAEGNVDLGITGQDMVAEVTFLLSQYSFQSRFEVFPVLRLESPLMKSWNLDLVLFRFCFTALFVVDIYVCMVCLHVDPSRSV